MISSEISSIFLHLNIFMISKMEKAYRDHIYANAVDVEICIENVAYFYKTFL